jgi:hypothetical protein
VAALVCRWLRSACRATNQPPDGHPLPEVPAELMGVFQSPGELFSVIGGSPRARQHFSEIVDNHYADVLLASLELMCAGLRVPVHRAMDVAMFGHEARADATPLVGRRELTGAIREELRRARADYQGLGDDDDYYRHECYVNALDDVLGIANRLEAISRRGGNADLRQRTGTDFDFT